MPQKSYSRGWPGRFAALYFLSLSILAAKDMRLSEVALAVSEPMEAVVNSLTFPDNKYRLQEYYTGIAPLDFGLRFLVAAFLPGVAGWDKGFQIQQIYFLVSFFSIIAIWSVEAGRKRNALALTSLYASSFSCSSPKHLAETRLDRTSIWALLYQTVGGAIVIPLYYLAYMRESAQKDYWSPASRQVSTSYARALLPSLVIGYLLPTILMYLPFSDPDLRVTQGLIALWQPTPLIVNLLLFVISAAYGNEPATSKKAASPPPGDIKYLNRLYLTCFSVSAIAHVGTIFVCLSSTHPQMSLTRALVRVPTNDLMSMTGGLHYIFQVDFWIIFTAAVTGAYLALWDLKRIGKTDLSLRNAAAGMAMAVICVGPAATVTGVWYIREHIMAQKDKR